MFSFIFWWKNYRNSFDLAQKWEINKEILIKINNLLHLNYNYISNTKNNDPKDHNNIYYIRITKIDICQSFYFDKFSLKTKKYDSYNK